jgi:hypothetical protein
METMTQPPLLATAIGLTLLTLLFCTQQDELELVEDIPKISNYKLHFLMNWFTKKVPILVGGLSIVLVAVFSCSKNDSETLVDGVTSTASTDLYINPLNIQVIDAANEGSFPDNATITIGGKDKAKIIAITGERLITLRNGFIELGVRNEHKPTAERPLEFNVLIQAPGYLDALKCFKISDATEAQQEVIKIVKTSNAPDGVLYSSKQAGLDGNGLVTADATITSAATAGLSVTLRQGTKLFDKNGTFLKGSVVKMSLWRFDATKETPVDAMPGGPFFCNASDDRNNDLGNGVLTPFGFYYVSMTVNNVEAKTFSIPLDVSMAVPISIKRTVNSLDLSPNPVRVGDLLPVWSLNASGQWVFEQMATAAIPTRNGFTVTFKSSHISYWAVADPSSPALYNWLRGGRVGVVPTAAATATCPNAGVTVQSNLPASAASRYFVKVRNAYNPWMTIGSLQSDLSNTRVLNLANVLGGNNQRVRLEVYNGEGGANLHRTDIIIPCSRPTLSLTDRIIRPSGAFTFNINLSAVCGTGAQTSTILPSANIFYSELTPNGAVRWKYLTRLVNGKASTDRLLKNVDYQFLIARGPLYATSAQLGFPRLNFNVPVCKVRFRNADWGVNTEVEARQANANTYNLELLRFAASARLCEKYSQYF